MTEMRSEDQGNILRSWQHCAIFLFACLIVVTRRPDAILRPQFWAEDGRVFFQEAYNFGGWHSLFRPYAGYFHTVPRLGAWLALFLPLALAPLVLNLIAIGVQALPVNLLISSRSARWGTLRYRTLLAGIYLVLPNMREIGANIANSLSLLALSGFILLVARPPKSDIGRVFDIVVLLLFGLSGPYCILLLPIAFFVALSRDNRWKWVTTGVVAVTSLVQGLGLLVLNSSGRVHYALGATPALFARILASQVYLAALIGSNSLGAKPGELIFGFLMGLAIGGTVIVVICFFNSGVEMKLLLAFSSIVFAASLISPMIPEQPGYSIWQLMSMAGGSHYWFFPTLAFAWSLLWCLNSRRTGLKITACYLLFFMPIAIARDWRQPADKNMEFAAHARQFQTVPSGTEVEIPINPEGWKMQLVKR